MMVLLPKPLPESGGLEKVQATFPLAPFDPTRHLTRYIQTRDDLTGGRAKYVHAVFGEVKTYPFVADGTFALSRADSNYDILAIDAPDPARTARYLRVNRPLLRRVARFAIVDESTVLRRARLLDGGCDDVLTLNRVTVQEARLRVGAVMRRRAANHPEWSAGGVSETDLAALCDPSALSPRERAVLTALAHHSNSMVAVHRIARLVAPADPVKFRRSLKVSISNIRRKLKPGLRIMAGSNGSYGLFRSERKPRG